MCQHWRCADEHPVAHSTSSTRQAALCHRPVPVQAQSTHFPEEDTHGLQMLHGVAVPAVEPPPSNPNNPYNPGAAPVVDAYGVVVPVEAVDERLDAGLVQRAQVAGGLARLLAQHHRLKGSGVGMGWGGGHEQSRGLAAHSQVQGQRCRASGQTCTHHCCAVKEAKRRVYCRHGTLNKHTSRPPFAVGNCGTTHGHTHSLRQMCAPKSSGRRQVSLHPILCCGFHRQQQSHSSSSPTCGEMSLKASMTTLPFTLCTGSTTTATARAFSASNDWQARQRKAGQANSQGQAGQGYSDYSGCV